MEILFADDHDLTLAGYKQIFPRNVQSSFFVTTAQQAIDIINTHNIDFVITDYSFENESINGAQICARAKEKNPACKTLVVTMWNSGDIIEEIMESKCNGIILKMNSTKEIKDAVRSIMDGDDFFSEEINRTLDSLNEAPRLNDLTEKEVKILRQLVKGNPRKNIADELEMSLRSLDAHIANVRLKLKVKNNIELLNIIIKNEIV